MKKLFIPLVAILFLFACNFSQNKEKDTTLQELKSPEPVRQAFQDDGLKKLQKTDDTDTPDTTASAAPSITADKSNDWDKKIIKTGSLTIQVKDFKKYSEILRTAVKQYGGYIANEEQNQSGETLESTVSIKVPVDRFDDMMSQLPEGTEKLVSKKISSDDVTGEIIDVKSRLQAKEQMRLKYLEFLKQSKNMEDVLKVQAEINDIQEVIESASGRVNYLKHQSSFSTINLVYFQPLPGYQPTNDNPGFFTRSILAFKSGFHFLAEIIIGIISVWPMILLVFVCLFIFKKVTVKGIAAKQKL